MSHNTAQRLNMPQKLQLHLCCLRKLCKEKNKGRKRRWSSGKLYTQSTRWVHIWPWDSEQPKHQGVQPLGCLPWLWSETELNSSSGSTTSSEWGLRKLLKVLGPQFNHLSNGNDNGAIFMVYLKDSKKKKPWDTGYRYWHIVSAQSVSSEGLGVYLGNTGQHSRPWAQETLPHEWFIAARNEGTDKSRSSTHIVWQQVCHGCILCHLPGETHGIIFMCSPQRPKGAAWLMGEMQFNVSIPELPKA